MIMQKVAPAADGSHELIGGSVVNRDATLTSISKIARVSLARFAWLVVLYNVAVIVWGAYVRATGSGAGCGSHWPLCNGEFLPTTPQTQTVIEFTHRVTSGLSLVLVAILLIWCWRRIAKGDWPRYSAVAAAVLLLNEALLGALLVLFDHAGGLDRSTTHALFSCLHFENTLFLLAALGLTARWISSGGRRFSAVRTPYQIIATRLGLVSVMVIGITGSLSSFGATIFPADSLSRARSFASIEDAIAAIRAGQMVIVVDDEDREKEGDLTIAAEKITPQAINFMAQYGRGLICLAMTPEQLDALEIPLMVAHNSSRFETAFCVSIEAREGTTTGISAADRASTVLAAIS